MFRYSVFLLIFSVNIYSQVSLPGFTTGDFNEQVFSFIFNSDINILINAPSRDNFIINKPSALVFYALPNGNTIDQTIGKKISPGDDWHFDIQHIGAQTRFLRDEIKDYNLITVYLEAQQKSWPAWKTKHPDYTGIIKSLTDSILSIFQAYDPFIILSGHSGGGRFIFSFMDAYEEIPSFVKRICFLDSNYGYETHYAKKLSHWLSSSPDNYLNVLAYNDSNVILNGKNIVSPTGGTWYRSKMMIKDLTEFFKMELTETGQFLKYSSAGNQISFALKKNPDNEIFHTIQVEKNGFIHSLLTGTEYENKNYEYFGERSYNNYIK